MGSRINRVFIECVNVRSVEERIERLKVRIREIDTQLRTEEDPVKRVALDGEWVTAHMTILNFRYLIGMKLDSILEQMYLNKQGRQADGCH